MHIDDVIEACQSTVYGIALTRTRSKDDADDIFQEVFLAYFRRNLAFKDAEHVKAWLINATMNCTKKCLRQRARAGIPMEELPEEIFAFEAPEDTALYDALCALAEPYRTVLHLFYFEDMPVERVAKALGRRAGTVRMQLTRGRALLREHMLLKQQKGEIFDESF
ncbi:MAG: sigma-70 family RNA polymerase sigma factor [Oscillospiraceae bacterium]|nr:sigma-70 family RNA polymerase sigma factor [Oscillospiraceae bacterium]